MGLHPLFLNALMGLIWFNSSHGPYLVPFFSYALKKPRPEAQTGVTNRDKTQFSKTGPYSVTLLPNCPSVPVAVGLEVAIPSPLSS